MKLKYVFMFLCAAGCAANVDSTESDEPELDTEAFTPSGIVTPAGHGPDLTKVESHTCGFVGDIPCNCWQICVHHQCVDVSKFETTSRHP